MKCTIRLRPSLLAQHMTSTMSLQFRRPRIVKLPLQHLSTTMLVRTPVCRIQCEVIEIEVCGNSCTDTYPIGHSAYVLLLNETIVLSPQLVRSWARAAAPRVCFFAPRVPKPGCRPSTQARVRRILCRIRWDDQVRSPGPCCEWH